MNTKKLHTLAIHFQRHCKSQAITVHRRSASLVRAERIHEPIPPKLPVVCRPNGTTDGLRPGHASRITGGTKLLQTLYIAQTCHRSRNCQFLV